MLLSVAILAPSELVASDIITLRAVIELPAYEPITGQPEAVVTECSQALLKAGKFSASALGLIHARRGDALCALGKVDDARADLEQALKLRPSDPMVRWKWACAIYDLNQASKAEGAMMKLISDFPNFAPPYAALAAIRINRGEHIDGQKLAEKAIGLILACNEPGTYLQVLSQCYFLLATCSLHNKDNEGALKHINRAIELQPLGKSQNGPIQYMFRGNLLAAMGKNWQALEDFKMARRLDPSSFDSAYSMWKSYHDLGKHFVCCRIAIELMKLDERNYKAHWAAAVSYREVCLYEEAARAAATAARLHPNDVEVLIELGRAQNLTGCWVDAIETLKEACRLKPDHPEALMALSFVFATCPNAMLRDGHKALELAERACKARGVGDPACLMSLAVARAECGEFAKAEDAVRRAIELVKGKQHDESIEVYQKCLTMFEQRKAIRCDLWNREARVRSVEVLGIDE
jgi:tetratricopeptide (TPR) repeat protein